VAVFAHLYINGDKTKAKRVLDKQKEISHNQLMQISLFSGGAITMIVLIFLYIFVYSVKHEKKNQELYDKELFELGPIHRLLFSIAFLALATAINIKFW